MSPGIIRLSQDKIHYCRIQFVRVFISCTHLVRSRCSLRTYMRRGEGSENDKQMGQPVVGWRAIGAVGRSGVLWCGVLCMRKLNENDNWPTDDSVYQPGAPTEMGKFHSKIIRALWVINIHGAHRPAHHRRHHNHHIIYIYVCLLDACLLAPMVRLSPNGRTSHPFW